MTAPTTRERNSHFRKIVEGLAGPLDKDRFEECVQDLLRQDFPGLVGVYGGSDGGMDGAIPDGEGEPFALVATTAENVIGNLTRSLDRLIEAGNSRRKAVLATSQALTPRRRKNLDQRAEEKGFMLLQIYERRNLAALLYYDSKWTKLLLEITGEPSALSPVPQTRRPLLDVELVGREDDLAWLRETTGDRLLVGEPGSGKTSLLLQLVQDGTALFLSDIEGFAPAFRDQRPEIVLVDDAHVEPERLDRLRQIRREIHAADDFSIVATSWKGGRGEVMDALGGISPKQVRSLELLTRSEIIEVYRGVGLALPADSSYLAELVTQAANRPGLAVTLGRAWLSEDYEEVLTGQAIYRSVVPSLKRFLDRDPEQLLAAFALGGDKGMGLFAVGSFLGQSVGEVWELVSQIGHSGLIAERGRDEEGEAILALEPDALRAPLLERVFFRPSGRPWEPLLRMAPHPQAALEAVIEAASRQVSVPRSEVRDLLLEMGSSRAWRDFAALGEEEATWVLCEYSGPPTDIAAAALSSAPRLAIRRLLESAEALEAGEGRGARRPLELLQSWSQEIPETNWLHELLRRRRLLVGTALETLRQGVSPHVALRAAFLALSPRVESHRTKVTGDAISWRQGTLPASAVREIRELWAQVRPRLSQLTPETWRELETALEWWIHPFNEVKPQTLEVFHAFVRDALMDLSRVGDERPGFVTALRGKAEAVELDLDLPPDPVFRILYPDPLSRSGDEQETLQQVMERNDEAAETLAVEWSFKPIPKVLDDLARYAEEAAWISRASQAPYRFEFALARAISTPEDWLAVALERNGSSSLTAKLLHSVVSQRRPGWRPLLESCLAHDCYSIAAAEEVLKMKNASEDQLTSALSLMTPHRVETVCLQGEASASTLRLLLRQGDADLAIAAAVGEWLSEPRETIREEIQEDWRNAILNPVASVDDFPGGRHWLGVILARDQDLAYDWIRSHVSHGESSIRLSTVESSPFAMAARALDESRRARLLQELPEENLRESLVRPLVGRSPALYLKLLEHTTRNALRVAPLAGSPPDKEWVRLALVALKHDVDPRHIATESIWPVSPYTPSPEHWKQYLNAFVGLENEAHTGLQQVARHGRALAQERIEKAEAELRHFELRGRR